MSDFMVPIVGKKAKKRNREQVVLEEGYEYTLQQWLPLDPPHNGCVTFQGQARSILGSKEKVFFGRQTVGGGFEVCSEKAMLEANFLLGKTAQALVTRQTVQGEPMNGMELETGEQAAHHFSTVGVGKTTGRALGAMTTSSQRSMKGFAKHLQSEHAIRGMDRTFVPKEVAALPNRVENFDRSKSGSYQVADITDLTFTATNVEFIDYQQRLRKEIPVVDRTAAISPFLETAQTPTPDVVAVRAVGCLVVDPLGRTGVVSSNLLLILHAASSMHGYQCLVCDVVRHTKKEVTAYYETMRTVLLQRGHLMYYIEKKALPRAPLQDVQRIREEAADAFFWAAPVRSEVTVEPPAKRRRL